MPTNQERIDEIVSSIVTFSKNVREMTSVFRHSLTIKQSEVINLIRHLYWTSEISEEWICRAFGIRSHELYASVGEASSPRPCRDCSEEFHLTVGSRRDLLDLEETLVLCPRCFNRRHWASGIGGEFPDEEMLERLRIMPYRDYLQTDIWKRRRAAKLKSAGHRCQVCNDNGNILDVHHRTYERRGNEHEDDLIVLCRPCHQIFHDNGRLSRPEGEAEGTNGPDPGPLSSSLWPPPWLKSLESDSQQSRPMTG